MPVSVSLTFMPVSYTHLDVYKRQGFDTSVFDNTKAGDYIIVKVKDLDAAAGWWQGSVKNASWTDLVAGSGVVELTSTQTSYAIRLTEEMCIRDSHNTVLLFLDLAGASNIRNSALEHMRRKHLFHYSFLPDKLILHSYNTQEILCETQMCIRDSPGVSPSQRIAQMPA